MRVRSIRKLRVEQLPHAVAHLDQRHDPARRILRQIHKVHDGVLPVINAPIHNRVAEISDFRISGKRLDVFLQVGIRKLRFQDGSVDILHGFAQLLREICAGNGFHGKRLRRVLRIFRRKRAKNHLRMADEVGVDVKTFRGFGQPHPFRLFNGRAFTFLEEEDICNDTGARIALKSIARQANGPEKISARRHIPAHAVRLLVHGAAGANHRDNAARTHQVYRPRDKVIVNQEIVPVILPVYHLIRAKGHVSNDHVKEIVREARIFKALYGNGIALVQLLCDSSSDAVDFYAVHAGVPHALRQHAHEIANAAGGFQYIAFAESHIFQCFVHRLDDGGRGVKGVQRGRPRRFKLLRCQRVQKLPVFIFPGGIIRFKGFLHAAPANIARQRFLFFRRRQPPLRLNAFEQKDGFHVHAEPGLGAARAEAGVGDMKIVALQFRRR